MIFLGASEFLRTNSLVVFERKVYNLVTRDPRHHPFYEFDSLKISVIFFIVGRCATKMQHLLFISIF